MMRRQRVPAPCRRGEPCAGVRAGATNGPTAAAAVRRRRPPRRRRAWREDAWNTRDPARVALAYTVDSRWRNRAEFLQGATRSKRSSPAKWSRELDYRLIKEVWAFRENRIAVRFAYEWHDDSGNWFRSYGNENWEFDEHGLMRLRVASINDLPIRKANGSITGRSAAVPTITRR